MIEDLCAAHVHDDDVDGAAHREDHHLQQAHHHLEQAMKRLR